MDNRMRYVLIAITLLNLWGMPSNFNIGVNRQSCIFVSSLAATTTTTFKPKNQIKEQNQIWVPSRKVGKRRDIHIPRTVRVRSTREEDLDSISNLLSQEVNVNEQINQKGFVASMRQLRRKSLLQKQITSRFHAREQGHKIISTANRELYSQIHASSNDHHNYDTSNYMREILWSQDTFRNTLELAIQQTTEPWFIWRYHDNMSVCPPCPSYLQHAMMTCCNESDEVVGFCEIFQSRFGTPMIANLIVSKNHRRQGIATQLLTHATRTIQQHWSFPSETIHHEKSINLYVHTQNHKAIQLYQQHGFLHDSSKDNSDENLLFLSKPIATA